MELYQLRYFQAVAEHGTLRDAAAELAVSQSAVSRAVGLLEAEVGVELFTRRGRSNELNRFGAEFLGAIRSARRSLDTAVASVRQLAGADGGTVALGFLHSLGVATVPTLIRRHHQSFPAARFDLRQRSGQDVVSELSAGLTDVCLTYPAAFAGPPDLAWGTLFTQRLYAVVDGDHRLAGRDVIAFEDLEGEDFVALDGDHALRRIFDDACARHGVVPHITFEGTDIATLRGLVGARLGIAVLPRAETRPGGLVELAVDDPRLVREIAVGWMSDRFLPPSAAAFRDTALAAFEPDGTARSAQ